MPLQLSSEARGLHLLTFLVCESSEGSDEAARLCWVNVDIMKLANTVDPDELYVPSHENVHFAYVQGLRGFA